MQTFKKIGIKSFVKFNVYYMGIIGLFQGVIMFLFSMFTKQVANSFGATGMETNAFSGFGIGLLIGPPLLYAFMGLIFGYIGGFIINTVLKLSGGIDIEFGDADVTEAEVLVDKDQSVKSD